MQVWLNNCLNEIKGSNQAYEALSYERWFKIAKPLHSLGKFEKIIRKMAGIKEKVDFGLDKKRLVVFCADNGIVSAKVTQAPQEVTKIVAENMLKKATSSSLMAEYADIEVCPIDIGICSDSLLENYKVAYGTKNFLEEPAMTQEEALQAIHIGFLQAQKAYEEDVDLLAVGEMGIGNTTTATALIAHLLSLDPYEITGRGAGLDDRGLAIKIQAIEDGIAKYQGLSTPLEVLAALGGFDIAGMVGLYIGAAFYRIPVVMDGLITWAAALVATQIKKEIQDFLIPSHASKEGAYLPVSNALGIEPLLYADMSLGEGSGALMMIPLIEMALQVYRRMSTFDEIKVKQYEDYHQC